MIHKTKILAASLLALGMSTQSPAANAQDPNYDTDCDIWLCLPAAFAPGCARAHTAFLRRLARFQPPLPPFRRCFRSGDGGFTQGRSDYIEPCREGFKEDFEFRLDTQLEIEPRMEEQRICRSETNFRDTYQPRQRRNLQFIRTEVDGEVYTSYFNSDYEILYTIGPDGLLSN